MANALRTDSIQLFAGDVDAVVRSETARFVPAPVQEGGLLILHRYFAHRFMIAFGITFVGLLSLVALVDLIDQTRRFANNGVGFSSLVELVMLNTPQTLGQLLPLIVLLAAVFLFVGLSRTSEMVATRAAGRSAPVALIAPVFMALLIGVTATLILNPIVAGTSKKYDELAQIYRTGGASTLSISAEGLWLRQGSSDGQSVIRAWRSNSDASILFDVTFLEYGQGNSPIRRIHAESAELLDGEWFLSDAKEWPLSKGANAEANAQSHATLLIPSSLTLDRIRERLGQPSTISIWDLPEFIRQLDQAGFSSRQHRVWMHSELAQPLFLAAMVLIASAFCMRHSRFGGTGIAVLTAVLCGFSLYFIRSFALILGENGQIPVYLAAWAPPVASILLALGPLLHLEEG